MNMTSSIPWQARLQRGSVYLRNIFLASALAFAVVSILGFGLSVANVAPIISFSSNCWALADALECWFAYKLFSHYMRGEWFAPQTVRWIQAIGALSLLRGCGNLWYNFHAHFHRPLAYRLENWPFALQAIIHVQFLFSQLLHNLVFGCVILFIAWVLDEGRKIQEEQQLTV